MKQVSVSRTSSRTLPRGGYLAGLLWLLSAAFGGCSGGGGQASSSSAPTPPPNPTPTQHTDVVTYKNDLARTGQNLTESVLTPANVNPASFGLLRILNVDGKVDATPLYLSVLTVQGAAHNVVFVATEMDSVYASDADSGSLLWHASLLGSGESVNDLPGYGCSQITPTIGITSTPVIDRNAGPHGIIYAVAMSVSGTGNTYHQRLHALDVTTGAEMLGGPVEISATYPTLGGTTSFDPAQYAERAALLLVNGTLYLSFTSHCDAPPYTGWIMAYSASSLARTAVLNVAPNSGGRNSPIICPKMWLNGSRFRNRSGWKNRSQRRYF